MFGRLTTDQRKALRQLLLRATLVTTLQKRIYLLEDAHLGYLINYLHLEEDNDTFVSELISECERFGKDPQRNEYATAALATYLRDEDKVVSRSEEARPLLNEIIALYHQGRQPETLRVLFLASNPSNTGKLSLKEEFDHIHQALATLTSLNLAPPVDLQLRENVKDDNIISLVQQVKPHILHFAGHGDLISPSHSASSVSGRGESDTWRGFKLVDQSNQPVKNLPDEAKPSGIILETGAGSARLLPDSVLVNLLLTPEIHRHIRVVFLNACWAAGQANAIVEQALVPFAIGMNQPIADPAAVRFAQGFYQTLFDRSFSVQSAYDSGKNQMVAVLGPGHETIPVCTPRRDLRPAPYFIFDHL